MMEANKKLELNMMPVHGVRDLLEVRTRNPLRISLGNKVLSISEL